PSSKTRKIAPANDSAQTNREAVTIKLNFGKQGEAHEDRAKPKAQDYQKRRRDRAAGLREQLQPDLRGFREGLNGARLQGTLHIIVGRQASQLVFEIRRLGRRLEDDGLARRRRTFMPNAIGQRRNALPEKSPDGSRLRTILPKQIVEKDYRRGHLPDLAGFLIERAFRRRDQQPQHE